MRKSFSVDFRKKGLSRVIIAVPSLPFTFNTGFASLILRSSLAVDILRVDNLHNIKRVVSNRKKYGCL